MRNFSILCLFSFTLISCCSSSILGAGDPMDGCMLIVSCEPFHIKYHEPLKIGELTGNVSVMYYIDKKGNEIRHRITSLRLFKGRKRIAFYYNPVFREREINFPEEITEYIDTIERYLKTPHLIIRTDCKSRLHKVNEVSLNIHVEKDVKAKIQISAPANMTEKDFEKKVSEVAESFGNNERVTYMFIPTKSTQGNCNTSSSTILLKSGLSKEELKNIKEQIPGFSTGFDSYARPWTKKEQEKAVEYETKVDEFNRSIREH